MKFELNEVEAAAARAFIAKHRVTDLAKLGYIGGQFSYEFTNTSLGHCVVIKDNVNKIEENITDFDAW